MTQVEKVFLIRQNYTKLRESATVVAIMLKEDEKTGDSNVHVLTNQKQAAKTGSVIAASLFPPVLSSIRCRSELLHR